MLPDLDNTLMPSYTTVYQLSFFNFKDWKYFLVHLSAAKPSDVINKSCLKALECRVPTGPYLPRRYSSEARI